MEEEKTMIENLYLVNRIVEDQDEALRFYTQKPGFEKKTDQPMGPDARFVTVAPEQDDTVEIYLDSIEGEEADRRAAMIGQQPPLAFTVDDCQETYETLRERGVGFTAEPEEQPYGIQAVASDLYGNGIALVENASEPEAR